MHSAGGRLGGPCWRSILVAKNINMTRSSGNAGVSPSDHLTRTAGNSRDPDIYEATIKATMALTPTVKGFQLKVAAKPGSTSGMTFMAGQWVDLFVPGVDKVGGFSVWSGPGLLRDKSLLELAVKESGDAQPAKWLHQEAKVGQDVAIRIGGDFHYPNPVVEAGPRLHNLLLVAGGIGINPLMSIMYHVHNLRGETAVPETNRVKLLYSARSADELALKDRIDKLAFDVNYFVTRGDEKVARGVGVNNRRLGIVDLEEALGSLGADHPTYCYLCGPSAMITEVAQHLQDLGMGKERIFYERWW